MMALYGEIAKDGHRLVLTGDGADEIFGGYPRYSKTLNWNFLPELSFQYFKKIASNEVSNRRLINYAGVSLLSSRTNEFWLFWHLLSSQKTINKLLPDLKPFDITPLGIELESIFGKGRVQSLMFRDLRTWLAMESNRKLDRISMWFSIEARSPFQSEQVIASAYRKMAIHKFKYVKKELLLRLYPELLSLPLNKEKHGFISPFGHWIRSNPNLVKNSLEKLSDFIPIQLSEVDKLSVSAKHGNYDDLKILWRLVILSEWFYNQK
jgi:asparagine synthase (glutamine-hydrolysing)